MTILGESPVRGSEQMHPVDLAAAFSDAVTGMAILDLDGRYRLVNDALCRMLGRPREELVGIQPYDITHPDDRPVSAEARRSLLSGQSEADQVRKRFLRPDGSVLTVLRTTTVLRDRDGRMSGLFTQMVDVSEAAEAQESLRRSERRFRALVAHATEMTVLVDRDGLIIWASPASASLIGAAPEEVEGKSCFSLLQTEDLSRAGEMFAGHLSGATRSGRSEYRLTCADGSWRYVEVATTNMLDDPDVAALVLNVKDVSERHQYEDRLSASEQRMHALVSNSWDVITLHDRDGRYLYCSPAVTQLLGYTPAELIGADPFTYLVHHEDEGAQVTFSEVVLGRGEGEPVEYRALHKNGTWRWLESTAHNSLEDPAVGGIVVTSRDVSARRRRDAQQAALAAMSGDALHGGVQLDFFRRCVGLVAEVLEIQHCSIIEQDSGGILRTVASSGKPLFEGSYDPAVEGRNRRLSAVSIAGKRSVVWSSSDEEPVLEPHPILVAGGINSGAAVVITDGPRLYGSLVVYAHAPEVFSADDISFLEATGNVIAAAIGRRRVESELRVQALHDDLTGLPNRVLLLDRLEAALARLDRHPGSVAILFVDTDDFKLVNDSLGHAAGDQVVSSVAERIVALLRRSDTVARFGGDEFVILCEETDVEEAEHVAGRIREALAEPMRVGGRSVVVTASVGIAVTSDCTLSAEDLLAQADTAMYAAKHAGKDRSAIFDFNMRKQVTERLDAVSGLRRALANQELRLHYQPIIDVETGDVAGTEALIRWQHPVDGLLGPDRFIEYAETSGVIVPVGAWVIGEAVRQAAAWAASGRPGMVAINVAGRQLSHSGIVETVQAAIESTNIQPEYVSLEVSENAMMSDVRRAARVLEDLRRIGVRIGMDDFGTGHSSLSHLSSLPFDFVKIDRSFIARFDDDRKAAALLETIATLCRSLELATVVEGVETERQLEQVRELGIPYVQGFLYGRPVAPEDVVWERRRIPTTGSGDRYPFAAFRAS